MSGTKHPETEQLIAYSERPESVELQSVSLHLAGCGQCRMDLQALSSLRQHAGWISTGSEDLSVDIAIEVDDLVHQRLSASAAVDLRERIKQNPAELKQALHYARHHTAMKKQVNKAVIKLPEISLAGRLKQRLTAFLQFETAVWKLIPLTVVLVAVVTLFGESFLQPTSIQLAKVIHFKDQARIQFVTQESQPGIGFFANSAQSSRPFEGVSVVLNNDREMTFSWPVIKDATNFQLKLQVFRDGETVVLGRVSSKDTNAVIRLLEDPGQHRYEWVLTGDTINKQSFQATGGFVVTQ